jgi:hypothetical protein
MRAINHALTGATIAVVVGEPVIAVPLSLASHFICDAIPHYGSNKPEKVELTSTSFQISLLIDALLCFLLVVILALYRPQYWILASVCAFAAASPDLLAIRRYVRVRRGLTFTRKGYYRFAAAIQWFEKPIGSVVEVVWFVAMLILVPIIHHR